MSLLEQFFEICQSFHLNIFKLELTNKNNSFRLFIYLFLSSQPTEKNKNEQNMIYKCSISCI